MHASYASRYDENWLQNFDHWSEDKQARRLGLSSVLDPERQAELESILQNRFGDAIIRFESQAEACGVVNGYSRPGQLGVDRWLALLGAAQHGGDVMIIDAGSAITLDLLRADGRHLGGAILPGLNTSTQRFRQIFAAIDFAAVKAADHDQPGSSTEAAIQIDYAQDSLRHLRELVERWRPLLNPNADLLLTGGDAFRLQREFGEQARILPDLVFQGMIRLANP